MKKMITKLLSILLVLAILVPTMGIMTSATSTEDIVNVWIVPKERDLTISYRQGCSSLKVGDVVTVGPISNNSNSEILRMRYKVDGSIKWLRIKPADCTIVDNINTNMNIVQYTIPALEGLDGSFLTVNYMFIESTLITINRPFDAEEYLAYMNDNGVDTSFLFPIEYTGLFKNIFPVSDDVFAGRLQTATTHDGQEVVIQSKNINYFTSTSIPVKEDDVVCFATLPYNVWFFDSENNYLQLSKTNISRECVEYCSSGCTIYALTVPKGATSMRITEYKKNYNNGTVAVTVNQPMLSYEDYQLCLNPFDAADAVLTVSGEYVYNGTPITPEISVTADGKVFTEGVDYTVSCENNVNAGTATVTATFTGHYAGSVSGTFTIAPRTVGLIWGENEMMYTGASFAPSVKVFGLLNGDACDVTVSGSAVTVGTYTAEAVALSNPNYALPENTTCEFSITFNPYIFAYDVGCIVYNAVSDDVENVVNNTLEDAAEVVSSELENAVDKAEAVVAEKVEELAVEAEEVASELASEAEKAVENAYDQAEDLIGSLLDLFGW